MYAVWVGRCQRWVGDQLETGKLCAADHGFTRIESKIFNTGGTGEHGVGRLQDFGSFYPSESVKSVADLSLVQISRPVGDQGQRFGDGLRRNGVHYELLAVGGNGVGSADTAHGGGFEQGVGRAQL